MWCDSLRMRGAIGEPQSRAKVRVGPPSSQGFFLKREERLVLLGTTATVARR